MNKLNDYSDEQLIEALEERGFSCTSESTGYVGYVATLECSAGNDSVGNMWIETHIVNGQTTVEELMEWKNSKAGCHGRLMITKAT